MERRKTLLMTWMLGGMVLAGLTGCSGDDDATAVPDDGVKVRRMTITETEDAAARKVLTRASLTESEGLLDASWTAGDALTYCNLSWTEARKDSPFSGGLTAVSSARASQFTGDVACKQGDYLAVVYPATTFTANTGYTVSLAGQDGTLQTLATRFHYVFGKAQVKEVTDQTATATMGRMKSLLTVCKFAFVDKDGGASIPVQSLTIAYGGTGGDAGTYSQSATVALDVNTAQDDVHATGAAGSDDGLTVTCSSAQAAVYVALLPTAAERSFRFTVTDADGKIYKGTARAALAEGEYIEATGLKVTKQTTR